MYSYSDDFDFYPHCIFYEPENALIIADTHIGFEISLLNSGIELPKSYYPEIKEMMKGYMESLNPKKIVIAGDIKEEFGELSYQEFKELHDFLDLVQDMNIEVARGNHDNFLINLLERRDIPFEDYIELDDKTVVTHGDELYEDTLDYDTIILGHEHPAIKVEEFLGSQKYECILTSQINKNQNKNWRDTELIVLPSFSPLKEGNIINKDFDFMSPYLKKSSSSSLVAHVYEDEWFHFPLSKILV